MDKPLISICIPTYNRCEQLKETIESIICQKEFLEGKAEIVISDNTSEDETESMCREYADRFPFFSYFRNPENIRDKNFPLAISRGKGVLRKLNHDTLVLHNDALKMMCDIVIKYKESKPVVYMPNPSTDSNDEELNFHDFLCKQGFRMTWIGSFTIWDSQCCNIESDVDGAELQLWQVRKVLELASKEDRVVIINRRYAEVVTVPNKNISYGLYKVFYENFIKLVSPYLEDQSISEDDKESIEKDLLYNFFTLWIIKWQRQNNGKSKKTHLYSEDENLKKLVFEHYKSKPYWNKYVVFFVASYVKEVYLVPIKHLILKRTKNGR